MEEDLIQEFRRYDKGLAAIWHEAENCTSCPLSKTRSHVVIGRGNPASGLWLVGEGPGYEEDLSALPFVGRAGQLLDKIRHRPHG